MIFTEKTYENILKSMLEKVPNDLDKREGSIIYNALSPAAFELAQAYFLMDNFLKLPFIDTSVDEYLTRICSQFGIYRKPATAAVKTAYFNNSSGLSFDVPIGSRFGINGIVYKVTKKLSTGVFEVNCETLGTIGNNPVGELLPLDNISGLATATLSSETVSAGADEETDESLRKRTSTKIVNPTTSGNINDYKLWALSISGVGEVKVFPLWNGNGTVKIVLVDANKRTVSNEVINSVLLHLEAVRPIGATVTVESAAELQIDISVSISKEDGYTDQAVRENIILSIKKYLSSIAFVQASISYARIGNAILDSEGVSDYADLTVNNGISNIPLSYTAESCQTPSLGMVTIT